jgi:class 3 adenylate cyclase
VDGATVHIAARIEAHAETNSVLVSRTVTDLMVGNTDVSFQSMGNFPLKGVSGDWELFQAQD